MHPTACKYMHTESCKVTSFTKIIEKRALFEAMRGGLCWFNIAMHMREIFDVFKDRTFALAFANCSQQRNQLRQHLLELNIINKNIRAWERRWPYDHS